MQNPQPNRSFRADCMNQCFYCGGQTTQTSFTDVAGFVAWVSLDSAMSIDSRPCECQMSGTAYRFFQYNNKLWYNILMWWCSRDRFECSFRWIDVSATGQWIHKNGRHVGRLRPKLSHAASFIFVGSVGGEGGWGWQTRSHSSQSTQHATAIF